MSVDTRSRHRYRSREDVSLRSATRRGRLDLSAFAYLAAPRGRSRRATTATGALLMTLKTYSGGCHCGAVRFEADVDIAEGTIKCNCSSCTKARSWLVFARADRFRLVSGGESQADYQWTPPGRDRPTIEFHFCRNCGIRTPGRGELQGGAFYAVQVPLLDNVDPDELAAAPIRYVDGRHDRFDQQPADTRFL
jgi:hypothetical protein